jgi:integrase
VRYSEDGQRLKAPRTFADRGQAEKWLRLKHAEIDSGAVLLAVPDRETVTFAEYAPSQIDSRNLKPRTRVLYQRQLALYLLPVFGKMRLTDITPTMVREWWRAFIPGIPTARAHSYSLLKSVLAAAMLEDPPLIDANPCRIRGAGATRRARRIRPATVEELAVIVEAMPERLRALVLIAAWGGLRWGEIAALRRCDIEGDVINVERAVVRLPGRDPDDDGPRRARFEVGTPKSEAGIRAVTMPASVMPAIRAHLNAMADRRPQALLFNNTLGGFLSVSLLDRYWFPAREAAGRPDLRFHDLRHTQAVFAAAGGATLAELMARLGHSTVGAALRYQHAAAGRDAAIAAKLSAFAAAPQTVQ